MAEIIEVTVKDVSRADTFRIIPLGDIHIGSAACDEDLLAKVVSGIARDPNAYWFGLGDYCEFINMRDWRFSVDDLADWITREDMLDLAKAQRDRFLKHIEPIAHKCWALAKGNHEFEIHRHSERAVYDEIVMKTKEAGKIEKDRNLALGTYGWVKTYYDRPDGQYRASVTFNIHHGFTGGRLKGAKALNMEKWLWTHECDIAIFGHSHNADVITAGVERVTNRGTIEIVTRRGVYGGTFRKTVGTGHETYSERKGYFPLPLMGCEITLRPGAECKDDRIRILI